MYRILAKFEEMSAYYQGKGFGSNTVVWECKQVAKLLTRPIEFFVDIGGNKGTYTGAMLELNPNSQGVIFEPCELNVSVLQDKFCQKDNITIEPFAISDSNDTVPLFFEEEGSGLRSLTKRRLDHFGIDFSQQKQIHSIVFEDYWNDKLKCRHIDVVKLDIEGHELVALDSFGKALHAIDIIQFEFGGCNIDTKSFFQDIWYFFLKNKFDIFRITPFGLQFIDKYSVLDESFRTTNYLAKNTR